MTDAKEKRIKPRIPVREPHKRTKTGIFDNLRQLPHPVEEFLGHVPVQPRDQEAEAQKSPLNITGLSEITGPVNSESLPDSNNLKNAKNLVRTANSTKTESPVKSTGPSNITSPVKSTSPVKN